MYIQLQLLMHLHLHPTLCSDNFLLLYVNKCSTPKREVGIKDSQTFSRHHKPLFNKSTAMHLSNLLSGVFLILFSLWSITQCQCIRSGPDCATANEQCSLLYNETTGAVSQIGWPAAKLVTLYCNKLGCL